MASPRTLLVVALTLAMALTARGAECGHQAGDAVCLFGACCSKDGMCGRGEDYCGDGCQEDAGRCNQSSKGTTVAAASTPECGHQAGDAVCLFGACCSEDGMCGRGDDYCGDGCQEDAGRCNTVRSAGAAMDHAECGSQAGDAVCLFGACCSKDGMCGRGEDYCGDGCQEDAGRCNKVAAV